MNFIPWRLIIFLIVIILITFFAGFNLQPVNISVGFYIFKDVPLFLALITFFIIGALIMVPFTIIGKMSKKKELKNKAGKKSQLPIETVDNQEILSGKENTGKKRNRVESV